MGAISPIGKTVKELWDGLRNGVCGVGPITRFDTANLKVKMAAEVRDFNPRDYMDKNDVLHSDRYAQFAIAAASQAVEESGVIGTVEPERIGVYFGTGVGGFDTFVTEHTKLLKSGPRRVSPHFITMMIANMAAGTIAIRYGCRGPAMPAVTACASGANAIGEAVRAVRHGYADAMICGGSEASISELGVAGFMNMQAMSTSDDPNAASLPFDARRAGFVIGEGGGALVIEEYERAVARGATILAEITGYGSTCDAYHITAPDPEGGGAARAMSDALRESGYRDDESVYVNAHGTGTPLNDAAETLAIKRAFGREKAGELIISSTKSMTGHMMGGAGAVEAIVCVMALRESTVPPTVNLLEPDPKCDLNYTPNVAVHRELDLAISNSLGFGGHNACLAFRKV